MLFGQKLYIHQKIGFFFPWKMFTLFEVFQDHDLVAEFYKIPKASSLRIPKVKKKA